MEPPTGHQDPIHFVYGARAQGGRDVVQLKEKTTQCLRSDLDGQFLDAAKADVDEVVKTCPVFCHFGLFDFDGNNPRASVV